MSQEENILIAKARFGSGLRIIVDDCPYCHNQHVHMSPVGEGRRMADCYRGEYILDFTEEEKKDA